MIYEQRIYHSMPGRLPDLIARFEHITIPIWERMGIRQAGFWTVLVGPGSHDLIYMLAWESLAEREQKWNAFMSDPEWRKKRAETEQNGPLLTSYDSLLLQPARFSAVQ